MIKSAITYFIYFIMSITLLAVLYFATAYGKHLTYVTFYQDETIKTIKENVKGACLK